MADRLLRRYRQRCRSGFCGRRMAFGGATYSTDFAITPDALAGSFPTKTEAGFVTRLNADGSQILYSTFVGANFDSSVSALALDQQGNVFVGGAARCKRRRAGAYRGPPSGCPPVLGFFSTFTLNGDDAFILKLSPGFSAPTFLADLGGACQDFISHLALDSAGRYLGNWRDPIERLSHHDATSRSGFRGVRRPDSWRPSTRPAPP